MAPRTLGHLRSWERNAAQGFGSPDRHHGVTGFEAEVSPKTSHRLAAKWTLLHDV
jgi:hypothetical protein